jgi:hypothetical protein
VTFFAFRANGKLGSKRKRADRRRQANRTRQRRTPAAKSGARSSPAAAAEPEMAMTRTNRATRTALLVCTVDTTTVGVGAVERNRRTNATWKRAAAVPISTETAEAGQAGRPEVPAAVAAGEADEPGAGTHLGGAGVTRTTSPSTLGIIPTRGTTARWPPRTIQVTLWSGVWLNDLRKSSLLLDAEFVTKKHGEMGLKAKKLTGVMSPGKLCCR